MEPLLFLNEIGLLVLASLVLIIPLFYKISREEMAYTTLSGLVLVLLNMAYTMDKTGITLNGLFIQDKLAIFFKIIFLIVAIAVVISSMEYIKLFSFHCSEFYSLFIFSLLGMMVMASAGDFITLFIALELTSIPLYVLVSYNKTDHSSIESGLKYFILGSVSSAILLYGISFIYGASGSTVFTEIMTVMSEKTSIDSLTILGMLLMLSGLCFKVAVVPFHIWVPDVYQGAPTPITAFLAVASKAAGFVIFTRILYFVLLPLHIEWTTLLAVLAAITMTVGNVIAIKQTNIKRLLGYSGIAHAGYLMIGLAAFSQLGVGSTFFYLFTYMFSNLAAFIVVIIFSNITKSDELSDYRGLIRRSPLLGIGMIFALLSLAGVPPMAGFVGKLYLLAAAVKGGIVWLAFVGIINVVISFYYYLKIVLSIFTHDSKDSSTPILISPILKYALYVAVAAIFVIGVYPAPFADFAIDAASGILF